MVFVHIPEVLGGSGSGRRVVVEGRTIDEVLRATAEANPALAAGLLEVDGSLHRRLSLFHHSRLIPREAHSATLVGPNDRLDVLVGVAGGADDVRMRGFRERATVEATVAAALSSVNRLAGEPIGVVDSVGRVLAESATATVDVPGFRRATMDGYAVQAADTYGATVYNPLPLVLLGASMPGAETTDDITSGTAARIMTGAPVPEGSDAVLRAEDAREIDGHVQAIAPVAEGKNIGRVGEDIEKGTTVLGAGHRLLPQDAGLLASIGHHPVSVIRRPIVRIIVSGDELLPPGELPTGHRIVDSNSPMLAALVARDGGLSQVMRLADDERSMRRALGLHGPDVIVTAGAASVGSEDRVPMLVDELGELLIHGVAMRPSSPTGVGRIGGTPVLILPGNPVSCLVGYDFFAGPVIRKMGGLSEEWPYRRRRLLLRKRLVSQIGRTDYARVVVVDGMVEPLAISGASVLSSVTRATGFVVIPADLEGYADGSEVDVHLYSEQPGI